MSPRIKRYIPTSKKLRNIILEKDKYISYQSERIEYLMKKEQELASIKFSRSYKIIKKINEIRKKVRNEK